MPVKDAHAASVGPSETAAPATTAVRAWSSQGRCSQPPWPASSSAPRANAHAADKSSRRCAPHAQPRVPRQGVACQHPATARQRREAFPARRVPLLGALADWGEHTMGPRTPPGPSARGLDHQGTPCRPATHPCAQPPGPGPRRADLAAQPPAGLDQHGQRPPPAAALGRSAALRGLPLSHGPGWCDPGRRHGLPLAPGACPPLGVRPLLHPANRHEKPVPVGALTVV